MSWLKDRLNGVRVTLFSTGKMFDPTDQERTCPLKDIGKKEQKKTDEKLKKAFGIKGEI
jgi:hypothetical protein